MRLASILAALLFAAPVWAQTTAYQQSFEDGDPAYTASLVCNDGFYDFFTRTDTTDIGDDYQIDGFDGTFIFAAQDIDDSTDCAGTGNLPQRISFDDIDISDLTNLSFAGLFAEDDASDGGEDWDDVDYVHVMYRIDSDDDADLMPLVWFEGADFTSTSGPFNGVAKQDTDFDGEGDGTTLTPTLTEFTASIAGTGSTLDIVILFSLDAGDEDIAVDNVRITGDPVSSTVSIAEARALGTGTEVTISGVVTRARGAFTYLQDGSAGITVRQTSGAFFDDVASGAIAPGTQLTITGTTSEFRGLFQINAGDLASYSIDGTTAVPAPQMMTLAEVGEDDEAELIQITDLSTTATGVFAAASNTDVTDATGMGILRVPNADDSVIDGTDVPTNTFTFTGVVGQFTTAVPAVDGYQLMAIDAGDVVEDEPPGTCEYAFNVIGLETGPFPISGGRALFLYSVDNTGNATPADVDVWATVQNSGGTQIFSRPGRGVMVPANATFRARYYQNVPVRTQADTYTYTLIAGTYNEDNPASSEICGMETFTIVKEDGTGAKTTPAPLVARDWADAGILDVEIIEGAALVTGDEVRVGPNPTRGTATFGFALAADDDVTLAVYDVQGRTVATVVEGRMEAGAHTATMTEALAPGVYVWQLRAGSRVETGRLTVVR